MAREKAAAAGLLCLLGHFVSSRNFQPSCHTDFATELICRWEIDATINCTKEFLLHYTAGFEEPSRECVPENEPGPASHCACIVLGEEFKSGTYALVLAKTDGDTEVWRGTLEMDSIVKPRPLINLTVEKRKDHTFILTWKRGYRQDSMLYRSAAIYEVDYWPKGKRGMNTVFPESSSYHEIFADNLISGSTYEASVRYKLELWGETWSEWSALCEWLNDFEPRPSKESWTFIPWLCVIVIALILTCYLSFLWGKRKWWDWVPSPAKSKMVEQMIADRWFSAAGKMPSAGEQAALPSDSGKQYVQQRECGPSCLQQETRLLLWGASAGRGGASGKAVGPPPSSPSSSAGRSQREVQSQDGGDLPPQPPEVNAGQVLVPEVPVIEGSLRIPSSSAPGVGLGSQEEESDWVPHEAAMASLFRDLLRGALKVGEPKDPGQSLAAPGPSPESCSSSASQGCVGKPADGEGSGPGWQGPSMFAAQGSSLPPRPGKSLAGPTAPFHPGRARPWAEDQPAPLASGYKSFHSLGGQARSSFSQAREPWPFPPQGSQTQPPSSTGPCLPPQSTAPLLRAPGAIPGGQGSHSLHGAASASASGTWLLPPRQGMVPEACARGDPEGPGGLSFLGAPLFPGCRSFSYTLKSGPTSPGFCNDGKSGLASPYKPFLSSAPQDNPMESPANQDPLDPSLEGVWGLVSPA